MENPSLRLMALSLLILILAPNLHYIPLLTAEPYDISKIIADNFELVALFPYRGPVYPVIGEYEEPQIEFLNENGEKMRMNFSEYYWKAVNGDIKLWWKYAGNVSAPIIIEANISPYYLMGGAHFYKHYEPEMYWLSGVEGHPYDYYSASYRTRDPVFFEMPWYLYLYVRLANNSKLVVPKGENAILLLAPRDKPLFRELLRLFLYQDRYSISCMYINVFSNLSYIKRADDPLSGLIALRWAVDGGIGGLAYTSPKKIQVADVSTRERAGSWGNYNKTEGRWDAVELLHENWFGAIETTVFAPASYPAPNIVNLLEPTDTICSNSNAAAIASRLSAMFIINPDVYNGSGRVSLDITTARGVSLAKFNIDVVVGDERFGNIEVDARSIDSEASPKRIRLALDKLKIEKMGYDEFGSLKLAIKHDFGFTTTERTYGPIYNTSFTSSMRGEGYGEVRIGGWLPNPPPPGNAIYVNELRYEVTGYGYWSSRHMDTIGQSTYCTCYCERCYTSDPSVPCNFAQCERYAEESASELCSGFEGTYISQPVELVDTSSYTSRANGAAQVIIQLSPIVVLIANVSDLERNRFYENRHEIEQVIDGTESWSPFRSKEVTVEVGNINETYVLRSYIVSQRSYVATRSYSYSEPSDVIFAPGAVAFLNDTSTVEPTVEPVIYLWSERDIALPGENTTIYVSRYGATGESARVTLKANVILINGTKIPLNITPSTITMGSGETKSATLSVPTIDKLMNLTGSNLTNIPTLIEIEGADEKGARSFFELLVYGAGAYLVLNLADVGLPLPDNPWETNVADYVLGRYWDQGAGSPQMNDFVLEYKILHKGAREEIYSGRTSRARVILPLTSINLTANEEYILSYKFYITGYEGAPVVVNDAGIDIVVPEDALERGSGDVVEFKYEVPIPYTLLKKYFEYSNILAGNDMNYATPISGISTLALSSLDTLRGVMASTSMPAHLSDAKESLLSVVDWLSGAAQRSLYLRPVVYFPTSWDSSSAIRTELSKLSEGISFRHYYYNLTRSSVAWDADNYWGKLAKLVILQAEMIRSYKYATNAILLFSQVVAMAVTVESLDEGLFNDIKIWNRGNILDKFKYSPWFNEKVSKALKVGKSTSILLDGDVLGLLGPLGGNALRNVINKIAGSIGADAEKLMLITSMLIRYLISLPLGELWRELLSELTYQLLLVIVAQALMAIYNIAMQIIVFDEVLISPYPRSGLDAFLAIMKGLGLKMYYGDANFYLIASKLEQNTKSEDLQWRLRNDRRGTIESLNAVKDLESAFFATAEAYMQAEKMGNAALSFMKELDSAVLTLLEDAQPARPGAAQGRFLKISSLKVGPEELKRLNDLINKLYLAIAAASLIDASIKIIWIPSFYYTLTIGDKVSEAITFFTLSSQVIVPAITFLLAARAPIPKLSEPQITPSGTSAFPVMKFMRMPGSLVVISAAETSPAQEMRDVVAESEALLMKFRGMVEKCQYNLTEIGALLDSLDRADLLMRKAIARASDYGLAANLTKISAVFTDNYYALTEAVEFLLMYPSTRPTSALMEEIDYRINAVLNNLRDANSLISSASNWRTPEGPVLVVRDLDIDTSRIWSDNEIKITVHNLGGRPANVSLALIGSGLYNSTQTGYSIVESGGSRAFTIKANIPSNYRGDLYLAVSVLIDGVEVDKLMFRAYYTQSDYRTFKGDGVEVVADGEVSFVSNGIQLRNVTIIHLLLPGGRSYALKLDGAQIRSGEIHSGDKVIVGAAFDSPISGVLTYEPVEMNTTRLAGSGQTAVSDWLSVGSSGDYELSLTFYEKDPLAYAAPSDVNIVKTFAIDLMKASAHAVTIRVNYVKLGISDPRAVKVLKYDVTRDAYVEVKGVSVDESRGEVLVTITPGDPIIAIGVATGITPSTTTTAPTVTTTTAPLTATSAPVSPEIPMAPLILAVAAVAAVALIYLMRRRKK